MKNVTAAAIRTNADNLAPLESQKEYRRRLSEFIRMHTARVEALDAGISPSALPSNSMLIIAQTGCGKSYTAARLAEAADVDLITVDCSSLTRAGYKGCNLGDLVQSAYHDAKDKSRFERSILFFDEADKLRDIREGNPQVNFLKLFDGIIQSDNFGSVKTLDVTRMSFLFAGAFVGLDEIVRSRISPKRSIGFFAADESIPEDTDLLSLATMQDIAEYGIMEELLGRIGTLCYIPPLTVADYRTLIKGGVGSVSYRCNNLLQSSGVTMDITDSACLHIAKEAQKSALGARAVNPIIFSELQKALCRVDDDPNINRVTLTCRNDRLALRCSHGPRLYPDGMEPQKPAAAPPDVSIAAYLTSNEGIEELCTIAQELFGHPLSVAAGTLHAFLRCTLLFMRSLELESDKVLSSLSKLANTTEKVQGAKRTTYDRIITDRLKRPSTDESNDLLSEAYNDFKSLEDDYTHTLLMGAIQSLRQNWYQGLLDAVTCA